MLQYLSMAPFSMYMYMYTSEIFFVGEITVLWGREIPTLKVNSSDYHSISASVYLTSNFNVIAKTWQEWIYSGCGF